MRKRLARAPLPLALLALTILPQAQAERTVANLKNFRSVCINAGFLEQEQENDKVRTKLIQQMFDTLDDAVVKVEDSPCQPKGLTENKQLNLYFDFVTTENGKAFNAELEVWLDKEGEYESVTLWKDNIFGTMTPGKGSTDAADALDELLKGFLEDWDKSH